MALLATGATSLAAPPRESAPAAASGTFEDRKVKLTLAGAYAFRDKTAGTSEDRVSPVAALSTVQ